MDIINLFKLVYPQNNLIKFISEQNIVRIIFAVSSVLLFVYFTWSSSDPSVVSASFTDKVLTLITVIAEYLPSNILLIF